MNKAQTLLLAPVLACSLVACHDEDTIITLDVKSEQVISESAGNFNGALHEGDAFGSAVALIGDLEVDGVVDIAVGAPLDDDNGIDRGAVWILFLNTDGTIDLEEKISSAEGGFGGTLDDDDQFGSAITGIGDLDADGTLDLAVGAPLDDDDGEDRGAVWILFMNADGSVRDEQKISSSDGGFSGNLADGDQFGSALAALDDLDGDGITDIAVGAPLDDDGDTDTGAIWILFMNTDGTVKAHQKISDTAGGFGGTLETGDGFGSALANASDLDGDTNTDLVVGSPGDDDGGTDTGAAWILFLDTNGTVISEQKISATETTGIDLFLSSNDGLGTAVANAGDLDGDGNADLVIGAPFDDDGGTDRGAAWILFMESTGKVHSTQKISSTEGVFIGPLANEDHFGAAIAGLGPLNASGENDLAIGAPSTDGIENDEGAVWILLMDGVDSRTLCERDILFRFLTTGHCL